MNIRHVRLIIKREYIEKLRSPGFIIGTVLGVLLFAGLSFLPQLLKVFDQPTTQKIAVVDPRNLIYPYIPKLTPTRVAPVAQQPGSASQVPTPSAVTIVFSRANRLSEQALSDEVKGGRLDAFITVEG